MRYHALAMSEAIGVPKAVSDEEIAWARHLLLNQRDVVLGTVHDGEPHMTVLYSGFCSADGGLRTHWISFPTTRHSRYIDEGRSAAAAPVGFTAVKFLLFDSSSVKVSLKLDGHARRVPEAGIEEALVLFEAVRARKGDLPVAGRPEVPYEAVITRALIPVPLRTADGLHVGETYAEVPLTALHGFDAPGPPAA